MVFISLMDAFVLQIQSSHGEIQNMLQNWHLAFKSLVAALTYGYNLQLANDCQSYVFSGFCFCCCRLSLITFACFGQGQYLQCPEEYAF